MQNFHKRDLQELSRTLPAGSKAKLTIHFGSNLKGDMLGYYRSSWVQDGKAKYALTRFQVFLITSHCYMMSISSVNSLPQQEEVFLAGMSRFSRPHLPSNLFLVLARPASAICLLSRHALSEEAICQEWSTRIFPLS